MSDFLTKVVIQYVGEKIGAASGIGGIAGYGIGTAAASAAIGLKEFGNVVDRMKDGNLQSSDVLALAIAGEGVLFGYGLIMGVGFPPLLPILLAASAGKIFMDRYGPAAFDLFDSLYDDISKGKQPWEFVPNASRALTDRMKAIDEARKSIPSPVSPTYRIVYIDPGARQGSCRLIHAANGCLSV